VLEGLEPNKRVYTCGVQTLKDKLDDEDIKILDQALEDVKVWTPYGLEQALKKRGLTLNEKAIRRHREKGCHCWKG